MQQQHPTTFEPVQKLVYGALVRVLGRERAEVVDFYVDSRLAAVDPERYQWAVERLLGEETGRLVINGVKSELTRSGAARRDGSDSFLGAVRRAEKALAYSRLV